MTAAGLLAALLFGAVASPALPVASPALRKSPPRQHRPPPAVVAKAPSASVDKDFNTCRKVPAGKPLVKLTLKPETTVDDLVVWISSITCRQFVWSEAVAARNKKVTIVAPMPMTTRQAFDLFLNALDSIGLTVEPAGSFWRIVETHKVKSTPVPLYGFDGRRLPG
jgi:general secretion pathway protein D